MRADEEELGVFEVEVFGVEGHPAETAELVEDSMWERISHCAPVSDSFTYSLVKSGPFGKFVLAGPSY